MSSTTDDWHMSVLEWPKPVIELGLRALRTANVLLDEMVYDVGVLAADLRRRGAVVTRHGRRTPGAPATQRNATQPGATPGFASIDLGAAGNPEGCILVVDPTRSPFVTRFDRVDDFITAANAEHADLAAVTVTGIGSSALGSAAFAWNVAVALGRPVAAIVPGYGVADVVTQAFGGWFGLGLQDWFTATTQEFLAAALPNAARAGHDFLATSPGRAAGPNGAPVFETGNAASDVLRTVVENVPHLTTLIGHSKGALVISNVLLSLRATTARDLSVVTFGCPIAETVPIARYHQYLGMFDWLGWINSWANGPERWIPAQHSTNTMIPLAVPVTALARAALAP